MRNPILAALALAAFAQFASAQTITGAIVGTVVDSSGAAVPSADATLTQLATGAIRNTKANDRGDFRFDSIQPGDYTLTITASGFKALRQTGINLSASETLPLGKITMEIGAVTESVTVTAQALAVQIASGDHTGLIDADQLEGLMTKSRNIMSLLSLLPGVYDAGTLGNQDFMDRNFELYVQGSRRSTTSVAVDGMTTNPMGNNFASSVNVSQDAISEVKVLLSNYAAEYGRTSGATVNVVTKSGTKSFHGLVSYFKRHEQFNANSYFNNLLNVPKSRYRYNTWSYNIGGPIYIPRKFNTEKNKLFLFWSQEFWPLKGSSALTQLTVPSDLERRGDFSQSLDLNGRVIAIRDPDTKAQFPGNIIPTSRLDPSGLALLKMQPLPNFSNRAISNGRYNYVFQADKETPVRLENLRADYNIKTGHNLSFTFAGFLDQQNGSIGVLTNVSTWPQMVKSYRLHGMAYVARYTGVWSPTLVNETSFGTTRRPESATASDEEIKRNQRATVGFVAGQLNPASNPLGLVPNASFGGVTNPASLKLEGRFPFNQNLKPYNLSSNLTKTHGPHTIKFGLHFERNFQGSNNDGTYSGDIAFANDGNNPLNTNYAYSNAAMGIFSTYTEASNRVYLHFRQHNFDWFAQDNWRATRRLTLELGMRFQQLIPIYMSTDQLSSFNLDLYKPANQPKLIAPALVGGVRVGMNPVTKEVVSATLIGALAPNSGDPANGMGVAGRNGYPRSLVDTYSLRLMPRFGFAYDVFGTGKTAIRGGFGIFFNRPNMSDNLLPFASNPPLVTNPTVYYSTLKSLSSSAAYVFPQTVYGFDQSDRVPRVMNFSFSIQHALGSRNMIEAGYVGSLGRNLLWRRNLNSIPVGTNFLPSAIDPTTNRPYATSFLRPIIGYNDVLMEEPASSSNYHSGHITARRRMTKGLQFGLSWTWSKAMDFNDNDADAISSLVNPRVWNYSLAAFDRTHLFKFNWQYNLPGHFRQAVLKQALNGWQFSGIASQLSGAPTTVSYTSANGIDVTGTATQSARIVVLSNPVLPKSDRDFYHNFRTDVFTVPTQGTWGNAARFILRGPGVNNFDLSILKEFPVREQMRFQFRAEAYNAFNHAQFSSMDTAARFDANGKQTNTGLSSFTAARAPRVMQFALRFYF